MKSYFYVIFISGEAAKGYTATVPSLPGISARGQTVEESISSVKDAIQHHIAGLLASGQPAPRDDEGALVTWVTVNV